MTGPKTTNRKPIRLVKRALRKPREHERVRSFIEKEEASHMAAQNRSFGGDAVGAKYKEFMLMYPGAADLSEEERDSLVSAYYNLTPLGFKNIFERPLLRHLKERSIESFDALGNVIKNRWTKAPKLYQGGIRRRTAGEYNMYNESRGRYLDENKEPIAQDIAYQQWRLNLLDNLKQETPLYNLRDAYKTGVEPTFEDDGYYHLPSRNEITGLYLKSAAHPSILKAMIEDLLFGYQPQIVGDRLGSLFSPFLNNMQYPFQIVRPQIQYPIINNE